jgi:hypothetical protein
LFDESDVLGVLNDYFGDGASDYASNSDSEGEEINFEEVEEADYGGIQAQLHNLATRRREEIIGTFLYEAEGYCGADGSIQPDHLNLCKCCCKKGPDNTRCITQFTPEQISLCRFASDGFDSNTTKDIMILSKIESGFHAGSQTMSTKKKPR